MISRLAIAIAKLIERCAGSLSLSQLSIRARARKKQSESSQALRSDAPTTNVADERSIDPRERRELAPLCRARRFAFIYLFVYLF